MHVYVQVLYGGVFVLTDCSVRVREGKCNIKHLVNLIEACFTLSVYYYNSSLAQNHNNKSSLVYSAESVP